MAESIPLYAPFWLISKSIDPQLRVAKLIDYRHIPSDEPIDLLNIAFENPRKIRVQADGNVGGIKKKKQRAILKNSVFIDEQLSERYNPDYLVPDRVAGLSELEELRRLCPGRQWNFVGLHGLMCAYRFNSGTSGRSRRTVHGIPRCARDGEIRYVA